MHTVIEAASCLIVAGQTTVWLRARAAARRKARTDRAVARLLPPASKVCPTKVRALRGACPVHQLARANWRWN